MKVEVCAFILALSGAVFAAHQAPVTMVDAKVRKPAPKFALRDAMGKTAKLKDFRGKVVLLDFWATWCTGCKQEMPWFVEFQKKYGSRGFAVVGVSMDEDEWKTLGPFLTEHPVFSYKMLLGSPSVAQEYGAAASLPDSFLIDKRGKLAATYKGVVDRDAMESNIQALLQ